MNDGNRFFLAALAWIAITLLTAISPALGALAGNIVRPTIEMVLGRVAKLRRLLFMRTGPKVSADATIK